MNETITEISNGAIEVTTFDDLLDAITSIVTIGMSEDSRLAIRHLSFPRFCADRLAALADREPNGISLALLLRIDAGEVASMLGPTWSLCSEADVRRWSELEQIALERSRAKTCCTTRPTPGRSGQLQQGAYRIRTLSIPPAHRPRRLI